MSEPKHLDSLANSRGARDWTAEQHLGALCALLSHGAHAAGWVSCMLERHTALHTACTHAESPARAQVVAILLDHGAAIDAPTERVPNLFAIAVRVTPLMRACESGAEDIAALLLKRGANPNLRDEFGRTALTYARESGNTQLLRMLARHGRVALSTRLRAAGGALIHRRWRSLWAMR